VERRKKRKRKMEKDDVERVENKTSPEEQRM
jgi:hypothetical protein